MASNVPTSACLALAQLLAQGRSAGHSFTTVARLDGCLFIPLTDSQRFYDAKTFADNSSTFVPDWRYSDSRYMLISLDTRLHAIYRAHVYSGVS